MTLARSFNVSPFEIMAQDCDEVIMLINYFIDKADNAEHPAAAPAAKGNKEQYIKVTNKTATGGWW